MKNVIKSTMLFLYPICGNSLTKILKLFTNRYDRMFSKLKVYWNTTSNWVRDHPVLQSCSPEVT